MLIALVPFLPDLDTARIAGVALWTLALYLGFWPLSDRIVHQLYQWLTPDESQNQRLPHSKESQYSLVASLLSVLPFLVGGVLCNYGVELGLGRSWAVSVGVIACVGCGVYELGRRDGQTPD
jgi:hypothetical protein